MDAEDKSDPDDEYWKMEARTLSSSPLSPAPSLPLLPLRLFCLPKYKQIKVNDLKWIRYLIILSS